ncbi:MAG: ABC transporter ATP-binding protein [Candidatus Omnitrophota bacterium]
MEIKSAFELSHLNVNFGPKAILQDLTIEMPAGAIGLLGPNGAGKSTMLKTLMGFIKPRSGGAKVFGYDSIFQGPHIRQLIGYMPEDDTYIPGMTAVEFVSYNGMLCGLPRKEAMLRAHQVLHYCGLGEARYRKVETYSTGMRQRIKLAQALVHDPSLLLLDEPTNGLDPQGRKDLLNLIKDITTKKDISVILSSHLLHDVEMVCEYMMVLFKGKLATAGKIKDLKQLAYVSYEVRVKGDNAPFRAALEKRGGVCANKRDGLMQVKMTETLGTEAIFSSARETGVQIRHMAREEMTLQEVFSSAIDSV